MAGYNTVIMIARYDLTTKGKIVDCHSRPLKGLPSIASRSIPPLGERDGEN
jgi:hypothetical protein